MTLTDRRLQTDVRIAVKSMYHDGDRLVARRAAYREIAIHQEGDGRSVYLTRLAAAGFALRLLWESFRR